MEQKVDSTSINNKLLIAGTRDFFRDHIDDLRPPMSDTSYRTHRGRDADAYYRSHHGIDTVIGHSLGGAVALSLGNSINNKGITLMELFNLKHSVRLQPGGFSGTNPNRIRWAGDPVSALDFNSTTVFPSFKQRWNNSAHIFWFVY